MTSHHITSHYILHYIILLFSCLLIITVYLSPGHCILMYCDFMKLLFLLQYNKVTTKYYVGLTPHHISTNHVGMVSLKSTGGALAVVYHCIQMCDCWSFSYTLPAIRHLFEIKVVLFTSRLRTTNSVTNYLCLPGLAKECDRWNAES